MKKIFIIVSLVLCTLPAHAQLNTLWEGDSLELNATYYGRTRNTEDNMSEIDVNALGLGIDYKSGYAGGIIGFDLGANANFGAGDGQSEILDYDPHSDEDESIAALRVAALKFQLGALHVVGGYTPITVGTIGTSGGLYTHSYRGIAADYTLGKLNIGYGIADQFHNEWSSGFYDMTDQWHQNRYGYSGGMDISYIHSIGISYKLGNDGNISAGVGEGNDYRQNMQLVLVYPIAAGDKLLTPTIFAHTGKYSEESGFDEDNEYHISASMVHASKLLALGFGYGYTWAPESEEMNFRLTAWANSDNNNAIQTYAQLDDFVWHNEQVVKVWADYQLASILPWKGFSIGANGNYGFNAGDNDGTAWEIDYYLAYSAPEDSFLAGLNAGIYMGHLRTDNDFGFVQDRDDLKVVIGYTYKMI